MSRPSRSTTGRWWIFSRFIRAWASVTGVSNLMVMGLRLIRSFTSMAHLLFERYGRSAAGSIAGRLSGRPRPAHAAAESYRRARGEVGAPPSHLECGRIPVPSEEAVQDAADGAVLVERGNG